MREGETTTTRRPFARVRDFFVRVWANEGRVAAKVETINFPNYV